MTTKTTTTEETPATKATIKHRNPDAYDPRELVIIGYDVDGDISDPLYDPQRVKLAVQKRPISIKLIVDGTPVPPIICVKRVIELDGVKRERLVVKDGRLRDMDARYAAEILEKKGEPICLVQVVIHSGMTDDQHALGVGAFNSHGVRESGMTRVLRAARLLVRTNDDWDTVKTNLNIKATATLKGYKRLAEGDPSLHKAVEEGTISVTAAAILAGLPREHQGPALSIALASGQKAVDDIWALVRTYGVEPEKVTEAERADDPQASLFVSAPIIVAPMAAPSSEPTTPTTPPPEAAKPPAKPAAEKEANNDLRGRPPKRRTLTRIVKRMQEECKDPDSGLKEDEKAMLAVIARVISYCQTAGETPPMIIAKYVRAEKAADEKRKAKKAEKAAK